MAPKAAPTRTSAAPQMLRADDFEVAQPPATIKGAKRTKALEKRWIEAKAILQLSSGKWLLASHVEKPTQKAPHTIVFSEMAAAGKDVPAAFVEDVLEDPHKRGNAFKRIIMGFQGGHFRHGNLQVRVEDLERKGPKNARVIFTFIGPDGEQLGDKASLTMDEFLEQYPPKPLEAGAALDLSKTPKLMPVTVIRSPPARRQL